MAIVTIKDQNTDNTAKVDSNSNLHVIGTSSGSGGSPVPSSITLVGAEDPNGNLQPLMVNAQGQLITTPGSGGTNGFSNLAPGYPKQVNVGTTSIELMPANTLRAYAHIFNNSTEAIYIQYSSAAALNQGIRIPPGTFFTLEDTNLWLGVINAIGLISNQFIDCLEAEQ